MFRSLIPSFCPAPSVEVVFRRVFGAQNFVLDLVPIKKPLIDGSLSWFVDKSVEIVLVSGVCGTSADLVADSVKFHALKLLRACGSGDALKGCHAVKRWIEREVCVRNLLSDMDLKVRLLFFSKSPIHVDEFPGISLTGDVLASCHENSEIHCSIYGVDAWEPHQQDRLLGNVTANGSVEELLRKAFNIVQIDAQLKEEEFASASERELNTILSCAEELGEWGVKTVVRRFEFNHVKCRRNKPSTDCGAFAASWNICDRLGNSERVDVPLVKLKDRNGLIYANYCGESQLSPSDETNILQLEDVGDVDTAPGLVDAACVQSIIRSICSTPLLQAAILRVGVEFLCGLWSPTRVENYVRSCGRLTVDAWLNERGQPTTAPTLPRCTSSFNHMSYLQECLPLEYGGSSATLLVSVGGMNFSFHMATTSYGRVLIAAHCFISAEVACSLLMPWYVAFPLSLICDGHYHSAEMICQRREDVRLPEAINTHTNFAGKSGVTEDVDGYPVVTVRVIDVETSLRKLGVSRGIFNGTSVEYFNEVNQRVLHFNEMDSIRGIARVIKRVRWSDGATFVSLDVVSSLRAPLVMASRALGGVALPKSPPYCRSIHLPVPLVPGKYFKLRFTGIVELDTVEQKILEMFEKAVEDGSSWKFQRRTPCYFNKWRLTRGIVSALLRYDPQFHYTVERFCPPVRTEGSRVSAVGDESERKLVLRLYSSERLVEEVKLHEGMLLSQVREQLISYALHWSLEFPPLEDAGLWFREFRRGGTCTFRNFVSWFLQNSEVFTIDGSVASLDLQITGDVKIQLASCRHWAGPGPARDGLCKLFLEKHFPTLVQVVELQKRVYSFLENCDVQGVLVFRCLDNSARGCGSGVTGRTHRWELLQEVTGADGECELVVLDAVEDVSRKVALEQLLGKVWPKYCTPPKLGLRVLEGPGVAGMYRFGAVGVENTIVRYQELLAERRGLRKVVHEYDAKKNILIVKGFDKDRNCEGSASSSIIRVVPLNTEYPLIFILHRYYRTELGLPDPPMTKGGDELRLASLLALYTDCARHFHSPLPPINEAITAIQRKSVWSVILRLPATLFALDGPDHLEYVYVSKGKHEGKRSVMRALYKSLHGQAPASLFTYLSGVVSSVPTSPTNCGKFNPVLGEVTTTVDSKPSRCSQNSMYDDLQRLIGAALSPQVGYKGAVECRLSHITGISARYVGLSSSDGDSVDLFHAVIHTDEWLPFQLLRTLGSCACRLLSAADLETLLLGKCSSWPSLFLGSSSNKRLFCTTFLRRYWGLQVYEADDVDELVRAPGAIYLVERTQPVGNLRECRHYEASLSLLQTPYPPGTAVFTKVLALHRNVSATRAQFGLWALVSQKLVRPHEPVATPDAFDRAIICTCGLISANVNVGL